MDVPVTLSGKITIPDPAPTSPLPIPFVAGNPWKRAYASIGGASGKLPDSSQATWLPALKNLTTGDDMILDGPPLSGSGVMVCRSSFVVVLENKGSSIVRVRAGIGVASVIPGGKPMYPWLGVMHAASDDKRSYRTLPPGDAREFTGFRVDIVSEDLQSDQPIPGWPSWKVNGAPKLILCGGCDTPGASVIYRDILFDAQVIR